MLTVTADFSWSELQSALSLALARSNLILCAHRHDFDFDFNFVTRLTLTHLNPAWNPGSHCLNRKNIRIQVIFDQNFDRAYEQNINKYHKGIAELVESSKTCAKLAIFSLAPTILSTQSSELLPPPDKGLE